MNRNRRDERRSWTGHGDARNGQPSPPAPPSYSGNSNRNVRNSTETGYHPSPNRHRTDQRPHPESVDQKPQEVNGAPCTPRTTDSLAVNNAHNYKRHSTSLLTLRTCPPLEKEEEKGEDINLLDNLSYHHKRMGQLLTEQISSSNKMISSLQGLEEVNKQLGTDKQALEKQVQKLETQNTEQSHLHEEEVAAWKERVAILKNLLEERNKAAEAQQQNIDKLEETVKEMKNAEKLCKAEMENLRQKNEQQIREAELAEKKYKEKVTALKKRDDAYLDLKNEATRKQRELNNATTKWKHFEEAAQSYQRENENLKVTNDKLEKENQKIKDMAEQRTQQLKSVSLEKDKLFLEKIKSDESAKGNIEILRKEVNDLAGQLRKEKMLREEMLDDYTTKVFSPSLLNKMVQERIQPSICTRQSLAESSHYDSLAVNRRPETIPDAAAIRKRKSADSSGGSGEDGGKKKKDLNVEGSPGRQEKVLVSY